MKTEFSSQIFEKTQILNLIKIRPVEDEMSHADAQTDRNDEANPNSRFS
jgi:hypothetical protein